MAAAAGPASAAAPAALALGIAEGVSRARSLLEKALLLLQREIRGVAVVDAPACAFRIECRDAGGGPGGEPAASFNLLFTGGALGDAILAHLPTDVLRWDYVSILRVGALFQIQCSEHIQTRASLSISSRSTSRGTGT